MMLWLAFLPMAAALDEECLLQSQAVTKDSAADSLDLPDCSDLKAIESFCKVEAHRGPARGSTCTFSCEHDGSVKNLVHGGSKGIELVSDSAGEENPMHTNFVSLPHVNCYDGRGAHSYGMEDWKSKGYKTSDNGCAHDCYHNSGCGGYVYFFAQGMCFQRTYISPDPIGECELGQIGTESWTFTTNIKKKSTPRGRGALGSFFEIPHVNCYNGRGGSDQGVEQSQGIKGSEEDCANHCNMADAACSAFVHMSAHGGLCFLRRWVSSDPVGECEKGQIGTESWLFTTYVS
ncbi:unnamed protein product [Symbiodinium pilosum]|uniref:Uncharacterized protein n=1 Tax=Symbiodinium pilosum TaxID=2952 RepID=A0A812PTZ3_SYMPI|nr:unnamed protein product [Symbiodinium pilosum]